MQKLILTHYAQEAILEAALLQALLTAQGMRYTSLLLRSSSLLILIQYLA